MALDLSQYTVPKARPLPVFLLLDGSGSMSGSKIECLNNAVNEMIASFKSLANKEVDINLGIITFGSSVDYPVQLQSVQDITDVHLNANGGTPMGIALRMAKDIIEDKEVITSKGYRPAVVLVSDGEPNDQGWQEQMDRFSLEGRTAKCDRFAIAIDSEGEKANRDVLKLFLRGTENPIYEASDASKIKDCFRQVTMSVSVRSQSKNPNELVVIPNTSQDLLEDDFQAKINALLGD